MTRVDDHKDDKHDATNDIIIADNKVTEAGMTSRQLFRPHGR